MADLVRTATRARAELVRDIRPAPAPRVPRLRRQTAAGPPRQWLSWGGPLTAAAVVVVLALSLVAVRQFAPRLHPFGGAATSALPRYYVAGTLTAPPSSNLWTYGPLIIGDDRTGNEVAVVNPPSGVSFLAAEGAADDRTFVVEGFQPGKKSTHQPRAVSVSVVWYLLRITPGAGQPYRLTRLPIPATWVSTGGQYSLSPDGRELAVFSVSDTRSARTTLRIYSMPTGRLLRTWTTSEQVTDGPGQVTMTWLSDGRQLAFSANLVDGVDRHLQLRSLNLTAPGTDLMAASRPLLTVPINGISSCWQLWATADGKTGICATRYGFAGGLGTKAGCARNLPQLVAYSLSTGKPRRSLVRWHYGQCAANGASLLWMNATGSQFAVGFWFAQSGNEMTAKSLTGVVVLSTAAGRLTPVPMPPALLMQRFPTMGF
jgi:hypothetical protein